MIATRTRAFTMLGLAFLLGLVAGGGVIVQAVRSGNASWVLRGRSPGRPTNTPYMQIERRLHFGLPQATRDSFNAISCRAMAAMDSIRAPLRGPMDSISRSVRPAIDSLFQTIRPAVETRRDQARSELRALLTPAQRVRYDSMNSADDELRRKQREQGGQGGPQPGGGGGGPCASSSGGPGPRGGFDRGPR